MCLKVSLQAACRRLDPTSHGSALDSAQHSTSCAHKQSEPEHDGALHSKGQHLFDAPFRVSHPSLSTVLLLNTVDTQCLSIRCMCIGPESFALVDRRLQFIKPGA